MQIKNKVAIVTGASRGIGKAIALNLAADGVNLVLVGRNASSLKQVATAAKKFNVTAEVCVTDLSQVTSAEQILSFSLEKFNKIDILVNNAGRSPASNDPIQADLSDWDHTLDLNLKSIYYLTQLIVPEIQKTKSGAVINISSISATMTYKNGGIYCASKHALKAYSGCLFDNIRETGIKVCSILPGYVNTEMAKSDDLNSKLMMQPEDVAGTVNFVLKTAATVCPTEIKLRPQKSPYL